ncbi:C25 family cysteine peptidase, partial [Bacteroidota bacterium]
GVINVSKNKISENLKGTPNRIVTDNGSKSVILEYNFSKYKYNSVKINNSIYQYINVDGFSKMGEVGKPALPSHSDMIAVPDNATASIKVISAEFKEYSDFYIHPALEPALDTEGAPEPDFVIDQKTYSSNNFYPSTNVEIVETQKLRGTKIAIIQIRPVQFNPVTKKIRVYSSIKYEVEFKGSNKSFERIGLESSLHYTSFLKRNLLNYGSIPDGQSLTNLGANNSRKDYIILSTPYYSDAADSLAKWKQQLGYTVEVVERASWTANQIRDSIHIRYNNWFPKPDYFVILGDHGDLPADEFMTGNPPTMYGSDLYFACMDGSVDYYPDMAYGRISVSSASQAISVVQKIINYERYPINDTNFYQNGLNCAQYQDDNTDGFADRRFTHTSEDIRDYLITKGYNVQRVYYTGGAVTPMYYNGGHYSPDSTLIPSVLLKSNGFQWNGGASQISNSINEGKFYVFHRDHGYVGGSGWAHPYYTKVSMNSLNNGNKLPVVFSVNCHTGEFTLNECFAEKFLRLSNGGAVGVFGASHASYSGYNDALSCGFVDAIWSSPGLTPTFGGGGVNNPGNPANSDVYTMGDVLNHGFLRMRQTWDGSGNGHKHQHKLFHYFGDPAMKMWTSNPIPIFANHPDTVIIGTTSIQISNSTCADALATLYYKDELIAKTQLNNGTAILNFIPLTDTSETVTLTLSKHNYKPYISEIEIETFGNPLNDEPCNPIELSVGKYCSPSLADNNGATSSSVSSPTCGNYNGADVWFMFEVPQSGNIIIECDTIYNGISDGVIAIYSGSCANLTQISCNDNSGNGNMPMISLTNQIVGDSLYVRFWENGGNQFGAFSICVYEPDTFNYATLPYYTGFENGLDQYWTTQSANTNGRIIIDTNCTSYSGIANLKMDVQSSGTTCLNESWLRLDLENETNVKMNFWWREFGDEDSGNDGIYFSNDGGDNFVKVIELRGSWDNWTNYLIDVDKLAQEAGLIFTDVFVIKFQQFDNWYSICNNPGGGDGFAFDEINVYNDSAVTYSSIPYTTSFENGLDNSWRINSTLSRGRIVSTSTKTPHLGNYHLTMDASLGGAYYTNQAKLHLDLSSESDVQLSFWWKDFGDENHTEDGIYFSDDGGDNFVKVKSLQDTSHFWMQKNLNVDALCQANNLSLSSSFVINFQQYDNYAIGADGMAFDDIEVNSNPKAYLTIEPYVFNYKVDTGKVYYETTDIINTGNDTLFVQSIQYQQPFSISPPTLSVLPGDTQQLAIQFAPDSVKSYLDMAYLLSNSVTGLDSIYFYGRGRDRRMYADIDTLNYDSIILLVRDTMEFHVFSEGTDRIRVTDINVSSPYKLVSGSSFNLDPNDDTVTVKILFRPLIAGTYSDNIHFETDGDDLYIPVIGHGITNVSVEENPEFLNIEIFPNPAKDNVYIKLNGETEIQFKLI